MGRKPEVEGQVKRIPLNMRSTQELRDKIEAAAAASGRSMVQEVEFRLEQSFAPPPPPPPTIEDALGGDDVALLGKVVAFTASTVQGVTGKSWRVDEDTREEVFIAAARVLRASLLRQDADVRALLDDAPEKAKRLATEVSLTLASPPYGEAFPTGTTVRFVHDNVDWAKTKRPASTS